MLSLFSPPEMAKRLADRIKELRLAKGWSQQEVARRTGIPKATYRYFERTGNVSLERFIRLLEVLGIVSEIENLGKNALAPQVTMEEFMKPTRKRGRTSQT